MGKEVLTEASRGGLRSKDATTEGKREKGRKARKG